MTEKSAITRAVAPAAGSWPALWRGSPIAVQTTVRHASSASLPRRAGDVHERDRPRAAGPALRVEVLDEAGLALGEQAAVVAQRRRAALLVEGHRELPAEAAVRAAVRRAALADDLLEVSRGQVAGRILAEWAGVG